MALTEVNSLGIKDLEVKTGDIAADAVTGAKIADDQIDSEHYVDASIDHQHLANDCVDGDNLADNACDSEHYTDGSIDHVHLAGDCVDGDNLADDACDSEHYTNGSIDEAHLANDAVSLAKMAPLARGRLIVGDDGGNPSALAIGTDNYVLTSDGTDVGWEVTQGGGKLLQMVGSSSNTNTVITSTTKTTTNLSQTITPSKTGSKMLFLCAGHYSQNHNGGQYGPQVIVSIYKQIGSGTDTEVHQVTYDYVAVENVYNSHHFAATYFDPTATLNTSDAIKYTIYAKLMYASHQMRFNPSSYTSLVIQEYDAT